MDVYGRDLYIVMADGQPKKIQDIAQGESLLGKNGNSHAVTSVGTLQGTVYPIHVGDKKFYIPGTQRLTLVCQSSNVFGKAGTIVHLTPDVIATQPKRVVDTLKLVKFGVERFCIGAAMPPNSAFLGRWANCNSANLAKTLAKFNKKKKALFASVIESHGLDPRSPAIPSGIFSASVESRFSFVRGFIDIVGHKIIKIKEPKNVRYEMLLQMSNLDMYPAMARLLGSLGYDCVKRLTILTVHGDTKRCLTRLLRKRISALVDHAHTAHFDMENTRQDIFYAVRADPHASGITLFGPDFITMS